MLGNSGEVTWSGTYQGFTQINNKAIPVDNGFVTDTWLAGYTAINDVNNVLGAIDVVNANSKDRVEGESKFIRGSVYFDLVRLFARSFNDGTPSANPGVPLVLAATTSVTEASKVSRNTVAEVYAQVITDLTDAEAKLPVSNGFYATTNAASAMLARVYLQKGDYANALAEADKVISSGKYSLTDPYAAAFPYLSPPAPVSNTTEDIFAMQVTTSSGFNGFQEFYSADGRGDITINDAHLNLYETGDDRLKLFYTSGGSTFTGKFDNLYGNVHIIRLAEIYLVRAEANFRLGSTTGATPLEDINTIRKRVLLPGLTPAQLTLAAILKERKLELAFEGFTLHDAKRLEMSVGILPWDSPKLIYPIPKREIVVNPNLTQNEGY
ncbi:MAG TPA: RagB/SusD family nutrient uptake outer membrane protein [Chitinophagaceae bacterium]|nr:RagB/SusD family nutrient uptake outer membrane protein [Chitinophagaceae bacterium]